MSTFVELLSGRAAERPEHPIFTFLDHDGEPAARLSFERLDRRAREIGAALQRGGLAGERALVVYPPGIEFIEALYGCIYAGVVAVPCPPPDPGRKYAGPRMRAIVADATPRALLTVTALEPSIDEVLAPGEAARNQQRIATDADLGSSPDDWRPPGTAADETALLQYTSGSTAVPRGVMVSQDNILDNCEFIGEGLALDEVSGGVMWLPPYHDMGLVGGMFSPVHTGRAMTLMSPVSFLLDPLGWLRAISRYRATTSGGPNFAFDLCVRRSSPADREGLDLSCWETAYNGAEPVRPETIDAFSEAFEPFGFRRSAFYPCYGLAEATLMVSGAEKGSEPRVLAADKAELEQGRFRAVSNDQPSLRLTSCGRPRPGARVRIVDPDSNEACADRTVAEIWVAGASVAHGYWGRGPETEATFNATLADTGEGPFLRTGDLGFLADGELYVTGRIKEVLVIDERVLYPADIELAAEAAAPGLRHNCSAAFLIETGRRPRLVIVSEVRAEHDGLESVYRAVRTAVSEKFGLEVGAICLIEPRTIPRTSSGKTRRGACRELFLKGRLQAVGEWLDVAGHSFD